MTKPLITDAIARADVTIADSTFPGATGFFNITRWLNVITANPLKLYREIREGRYTGDLTPVFASACASLTKLWTTQKGASTPYPPGIFVPGGDWPLRRFHWPSWIPIIGEGRNVTRLVFAPDGKDSYPVGYDERCQFLIRAAGVLEAAGDPLLTHGYLADLTLCGYPGARWFDTAAPTLRPWHLARHLLVAVKDVDFKFTLARVGLEACRSDAVLLLHGALNCYVNDIEARGIGGYVFTITTKSKDGRASVKLDAVGCLQGLDGDKAQKDELQEAQAGSALVGSGTPLVGPAHFALTTVPSEHNESVLSFEGITWQSSLPPAVLLQDTAGLFLGKPFGAGVARLLKTGGDFIRFRDVSVEGDTRLIRMPPATDKDSVLASTPLRPPALFLVQGGVTADERDGTVDIDDISGTVNPLDQVDIVRTEAVGDGFKGVRVTLGAPWVDGAAFALRDVRAPPQGALVRVPYDTVPADRAGAVFCQVGGGSANGVVLNGVRISGRPTPLVRDTGDYTRFRPGDVVFVRQAGYRNAAGVEPAMTSTVYYPDPGQSTFATAQRIERAALNGASPAYLGEASPIADVSPAAHEEAGWLSVARNVGTYYSTLFMPTVGGELLKDVLFVPSPYSDPVGPSSQIHELAIGDLVVIERVFGAAAFKIGGYSGIVVGTGDYSVRVIRNIDAIRRWIRLDAPIAVPSNPIPLEFFIRRFKVTVVAAAMLPWLRQQA